MDCLFITLFITLHFILKIFLTVIESDDLNCKYNYCGIKQKKILIKMKIMG